jgi:N12 class adenine-specific DNA methylase
MREEFARWIWKDAKRAGDILDVYNHKFNNLAPRTFDGEHLKLPGLSTRYSCTRTRSARSGADADRQHVPRARGGCRQDAGNDRVGMEQKRLGLIKTPMFVVPNHMLNQFAAEFLDAYPAADVMVADEENFHTDNRKRFVAQAAMNNPDAIIITHSRVRQARGAGRGRRRCSTG